MLHSKARWSIPKADGDTVRQLIEQLNISPVLASLLTVRGLSGVEEAKRFLYGKEDLLHDPFLLDGMEKAVGRIRRAIHNKERIRIYGDYDADGVSSTSLMIVLMRELKADFDFYIPQRQTEGYGLNTAAIDLAYKHGVSLIITVDTGISAAAEVKYAMQCGIEVIVTDHHEPPERLPPACAVINPKKPECSYPFKQLAGVGVAFKLAQALLGRFPGELLEFAAVGTVADLMPLTGENRILVKLGLERIRSKPSVGICALLGIAGIERREINAGHIGFVLAPRINAGGRLERADKAVICLTTDNEQEAEHLAFDLDRLNRERQLIVEQISAEAMEQAERLRAAGLMDKVLVLAGEGWNAGVVGIVASKVLDRYYRPTLVLGIDHETGITKGSARSIPGFDIHAALTECDELLDHYGGHQAAAGMSLHRERLPELHRRLNDIADAKLTEEQLIPELTADMEIPVEDISPEMIGQLELLAPFGMQNPIPRFVLHGVRLKELKLLGRDQQHIKLSLHAGELNSATIEAIGFGKSDWASLISSTDQIDIFGELSNNEWNGIQRPQIIVQDIRIPGKQVFDWRGRKMSDPLVKLWFKRSELPLQNCGSKGVAIFRQEQWSLLTNGKGASGTDVPVWLVADACDLEPLNHAAQLAAPGETHDLLLLSMPPSIRRMEAVLSHFYRSDRVYALLQDTVPFLSGIMPSREQFKQVYGLLLREAEMEGLNSDAAKDLLSIERSIIRHTGLPAGAVQFILTVFDDLSFIRMDGRQLRVHASPVKRELEESRTYREKLHRDEVEREFVYSNSHELKNWILERLPSMDHNLLEESV